MKTKNLGHTHIVCQSCQHHNRTTTSLSVGRYMYASTVCLFFFSRALCRENKIILLPTYSTYQVAGDSKLFQVLLAIGGGFLSFLRASYYITTTAAAA